MKNGGGGVGEGGGAGGGPGGGQEMQDKTWPPYEIVFMSEKICPNGHYFLEMCVELGWFTPCAVFCPLTRQHPPFFTEAATLYHE